MRARPWASSVQIRIWCPRNDRAGVPRVARVIARSADVTCSPVATTTSDSRAEGSDDRARTRPRRRSVSPAIAETTTITAFPALAVAATRRATSWIRSTVPTEVPPYFWTTSGRPYLRTTVATLTWPPLSRRRPRGRSRRPPPGSRARARRPPPRSRCSPRSLRAAPRRRGARTTRPRRSHRHRAAPRANPDREGAPRVDRGPDAPDDAFLHTPQPSRTWGYGRIARRRRERARCPGRAPSFRRRAARAAPRPSPVQARERAARRPVPSRPPNESEG